MNAQQAQFSDAARRCSDIVNLHVSLGFHGHWVAIRLSDGGSDGVLYHNKRAAAWHQLHPEQCCYIQMPPNGMTARDAERYLEMHRSMYAKGLRLTDPDDADKIPSLRLDYDPE